MSGTIRVGISGWRYAPWRGVFYPKGLAQKRELAYAAEQFGSIEINGTFYSLQRPGSFARWADETPESFVFSVKAPRFITHMRRLHEIEAPLANFFASGVLRLGRKLGPVLWQLPPTLAFDVERFAHFAAALPHDMAAALRLARRHDARLEGRVWLEIEGNGTIRHAVEVRHESFRSEAFVRLLRRHRIALVCADSVEWPRLMDLTGDFVYCRLHGSKELYTSGYDAASLDAWARRARAWVAGREPADAETIAGRSPSRRSKRDVFLYFDNDRKVRAPADAASLARRLGIA